MLKNVKSLSSFLAICLKVYLADFEDYYCKVIRQADKLYRQEQVFYIQAL